MSVIPCEQNSDLRAQIERFAEVLKTEAHRLGDHGLTSATSIIPACFAAPSSG